MKDREIDPITEADFGTRNLRVLSLFSGAGGLDLGFEEAGFNIKYATDIDIDCCDSLRLNAGGYLSSDLQVEQADIRLINPSDLPSKIDLVIGGPPCQSFSASGRRAGGAPGRLDPRGQLFEAYCRIIKHLEPAAFVFENVRGILGTNKGEDWKAIVRAFADIGYKLTYRILDALDYGAPQQRERLFLVGHKLDTPFLFPRPTHGPDSLNQTPHVTAGEALQGIQETEDLSKLKLEDGKYSHLLPLVPPGQNYLFFTAKRGYPEPIFAYRSRFSDFLYKASPDLPIKTLIARPGKYTGPMHWENRYFSVKEYMRLQGFPDDYLLSGLRDDKIRQIGNSVSPKVAYKLALAIDKQIFGATTEVELLPENYNLSFDTRKGLKASRTRNMHEEVARTAPQNKQTFFRIHGYKGNVEPSSSLGEFNVLAKASRGKVFIQVLTDASKEMFAEMTLSIQQGIVNANSASIDRVTLKVEGYGKSPGTIQAMWNAVDDWVRRSSNFHSLFELYGHFTEPHPMFSIERFIALTKHPLGIFAEHASHFENCSRYFPKSHLVELFSDILGTESFEDIASFLRSFRFDIRSNETNVAIDKGVYMVAYPFTLPSRRQMNFKVKKVAQQTDEDLKKSSDPLWLQTTSTTK